MELYHEQEVIRRRNGYQVMAGTRFPREDILYRLTKGDRTIGWQIVEGLCAGIPDSHTEYQTKREALEDWYGVCLAPTLAQTGYHVGSNGLWYGSIDQRPAR